MGMQAKKKVLVGGCFDILHYGHVHFLKKARSLGDYLIVALESDQNIKRLKGGGRPFHDQEKRREMLESLTFVDEVIILGPKMMDRDYEKLVIEVKPNIIAATKGDVMLEKKRDHAKKIGAKIIEIPKVKVASTSQIAKLLRLE